jgi:hypothetical protein
MNEARGLEDSYASVSRIPFSTEIADVIPAEKWAGIVGNNCFWKKLFYVEQFWPLNRRIGC